MSDYLTGVEAYELDAVEAVLDADPSSSDVVYKETIDLSERSIAAVAAMRAGGGGGGGGGSLPEGWTQANDPADVDMHEGSLVATDPDSPTQNMELRGSRLVVKDDDTGTGIDIDCTTMVQLTPPAGTAGIQLLAAAGGDTALDGGGMTMVNVGAMVDATLVESRLRSDDNSQYLSVNDFGVSLDASLIGFFSVPPAAQPVVPLTIPTVQDVIDALVALGLVSQSD